MTTKREKKKLVITIDVKKVSRKKAKKDIHSYIASHEGCLTEQIIIALQYDPELVLSILDELKEEDEVSNRKTK